MRIRFLPILFALALMLAACGGAAAPAASGGAAAPTPAVPADIPGPAVRR